MGCAHSPPVRSQIADTTPVAPQWGPRIINRRPTVETPEWYVELKPEFDQNKYAFIIASRVGGKVGYIYQNFHAFSIHTMPDSMAAKIGKMPEVSAVIKSTVLHLD
jgi:hypothetical protein